jgi:serine/threonine protein kinase
VLGCGAFGGVFLADEMLAGRQISEVAVKLISPPSGDPDEQMRELIAMRNLNHPHVARGLSVGQCTLDFVSLMYVVMDVAEGTLGTRLSQGVLDGAEAEELTLHVCEGLDYLHARRVTHRDLKPANVLRASGGWQLSDLGLIREVGEYSAVYTKSFAGTLPYMPPETFRGEVAPAGDVWSFGVMLVEALTGRRPFRGKTQEQLSHAIQHDEPNIASILPERLDGLVRGCLLKDRRARLTARQVLDSLRAPADGPPARPTPDDRDERRIRRLEKEIRFMGSVEKLVGLAETFPRLRDRIIDGLVCVVTGARRHVSPTERQNAYYALGRLGGGEAESALRQGLEDEDEWARRGAERAWEVIGKSAETLRD